ncbi:pyocin knob domain-containing protein [Nocardioides soli]|uniref:Uncharacterized protein n=1 Tax=Nocardioides soli TaxID=1036020 RepID=A0A7W4YZS3_9ACTN|nr:pyocin knob domain-containing protein [Nocardioides soli]MBB3041237.1 hypothetical protein [Nocardioides soli]
MSLATAEALNAAAEAARAGAEDARDEAEAARDQSLAVPQLVDAKGDLLVGTAPDTAGRLPVGVNGAFLKADSTKTSGLAWVEGETTLATYRPAQDLNTLVTPGFWTVDSTSANRPASGLSGNVHVMFQATYVSQRFVAGQRSFFRSSGDGGATWTPWIEERTSAALPGNTITGTGSPEGVITAPVGSRYIDTNATNGAVEWIKATGSGATGWKVVYGDTGFRFLSRWDPAGVVTGWPLSQSWAPVLGATGWIAAQRTGPMVQIWVRALRKLNHTTDRVHADGYNLPPGMTPYQATPVLAQIGVGTVMTINVSTGGSLTRGYGNQGAPTTGDINQDVAWSYPASSTAPWPTTLPGTAA